MKKILITGANSYIGMSFENYMRQWDEDYRIETLDMLDASWREKDFSEYDVVFHVAGIAHADVKKVKDEEKQLYYKVNCDLAVETAEKSRKEGVSQFILMSSMIIYGKQNFITKDTLPSPMNFYGDSKWKGDQGVRKIQSDDFKVVVLRPPMIYGRNSKGNYRSLAKFAKKVPLFPFYENKRSMLYIGNLCEFVKRMIDNEEKGIFFPQNKQYVSTCEMVKIIAEIHSNRIFFIKGLGWIVKLVMHFSGKFGNLIAKVFGDSVYDLEISKYKEDYQIYSLYDSLYESEG